MNESAQARILDTVSCGMPELRDFLLSNVRFITCRASIQHCTPALQFYYSLREATLLGMNFTRNQVDTRKGNSKGESGSNYKSKGFADAIASKESSSQSISWARGSSQQNFRRDSETHDRSRSDMHSESHGNFFNTGFDRSRTQNKGTANSQSRSDSQSHARSVSGRMNTGAGGSRSSSGTAPYETTACDLTCDDYQRIFDLTNDATSVSGLLEYTILNGAIIAFIALLGAGLAGLYFNIFWLAVSGFSTLGLALNSAYTASNTTLFNTAVEKWKMCGCLADDWTTLKNYLNCLVSAPDPNNPCVLPPSHGRAFNWNSSVRFYFKMTFGRQSDKQEYEDSDKSNNGYLLGISITAESKRSRSQSWKIQAVKSDGKSYHVANNKGRSDSRSFDVSKAQSYGVSHDAGSTRHNVQRTGRSAREAFMNLLACTTSTMDSDGESHSRNDQKSSYRGDMQGQSASKKQNHSEAQGESFSNSLSASSFYAWSQAFDALKAMYDEVNQDYTEALQLVSLQQGRIYGGKLSCVQTYENQIQYLNNLRKIPCVRRII